MLGLKFGKVNPLVARALTRLSNAFGRAGRYTLGQSGKPFEETFEGNILTHDPVRYGRHRAQIAANPDLALGATTWGWLDFALRATDVLSRPERLRGVTVPVDIVSAEDDSLVDNAAQAAAARNLPQGRLITVPGAYHEILMETDAMRNIFLRVFDALTGKVAPKPLEAPTAAPPPIAEAAAPIPPAAAPPAANKTLAKPAPAKKAETPAAKSKPAQPKAKAPKAVATKTSAAKSGAAKAVAKPVKAPAKTATKVSATPKAKPTAATAAPVKIAPAKTSSVKKAPAAKKAAAKASKKAPK